MVSVSLCMIVKNEEKRLGRCLDSVRGLVDEIVVVDTGSTDATRDLARKYTDRVYDFTWCADFSAARNFSFSLATGDYLLWLDADDVFTAGPSWQQLKNGDFEPFDVMMLPYRVAFDENGACLLSYERERVLRRQAGFRWQGRVHEVIEPAGTVIRRNDTFVAHLPGQKPKTRRNLEIYEAMRGAGEPFSTRDLYYYGRECLEHGQTETAGRVLEEFLQRKDGWIEDRKQAFLLMSSLAEQCGDAEKRLRFLLRALELDAPSASLCLALGRAYLDAGHTATAEFWFQSALSCRRSVHGFVREDDYAFLPYVWLCVCRDRQGDREGAIRYHRLAKAIHPSDPSVQYNEKLFFG